LIYHIVNQDASGSDFDIGIIPFYDRINSNKMVGDSLYLLHYAVDQLSTITSFSITDNDQKVILPVSSLYEEVMSAKDLSDLEIIYKQLYSAIHYKLPKLASKIKTL